MARTETVEFTNMCMICDGSRVVVIDRKKRDWPGITFPGGHIEPGESFTDAVIREVQEETGLHIRSPQLCGIILIGSLFYQEYRNKTYINWITYGFSKKKI